MIVVYGAGATAALGAGHPFRLPVDAVGFLAFLPLAAGVHYANEYADYGTDLLTEHAVLRLERGARPDRPPSTTRAPGGSRFPARMERRGPRGDGDGDGDPRRPGRRTPRRPRGRLLPAAAGARVAGTGRGDNALPTVSYSRRTATPSSPGRSIQASRSRSSRSRRSCSRTCSSRGGRTGRRTRSSGSGRSRPGSRWRRSGRSTPGPSSPGSAASASSTAVRCRRPSAGRPSPEHRSSRGAWRRSRAGGRRSRRWRGIVVVALAQFDGWVAVAW